MGILNNAEEIDRLNILQDQLEIKETAAKQTARQAEAEVMRCELQRKQAFDRVESLSDGIAATIPETIDECLMLAALLRSMTEGNVFFEHDGAYRDRAERLVGNLLIGLNRLSPSKSFPTWIAEHIRHAEAEFEDGFSEHVSGHSITPKRSEKPN